jgi:hypothetical protein
MPLPPLLHSGVKYQPMHSPSIPVADPAIHYPPIAQQPENAIRAEQHEDISLITLLVGASARRPANSF